MTFSRPRTLADEVRRIDQQILVNADNLRRGGSEGLQLMLRRAIDGLLERRYQLLPIAHTSTSEAARRAMADMETK